MGRRRFNDSPISAKKEELAKKEEELRREMEELQRTIEEAPKLAQAEQERQRRGEDRACVYETESVRFPGYFARLAPRGGPVFRPSASPEACATASGAHASSHLLPSRLGSSRDCDLPRDSNV